MRGHNVSGCLKMVLLCCCLVACQNTVAPSVSDLRQQERSVPQPLRITLRCGDGQSEHCTFGHKQFSQTLTLHIANSSNTPMWVYLLNSKGVPTIQAYYRDAQQNRVRVDIAHTWRKRVQIPAGEEYVMPFKITQLDMRQASKRRIYVESAQFDVVLPENGATLWFKDYLEFEFVK